jgi:predicted transcriptional regulator
VIPSRGAHQAARSSALVVRGQERNKKRRRSFLSIAAAILRTCRSGARRTQVLYRAHLSFEQLNKYLDLLQESKLILHEESTKLYVLTDKGKRFLDHHDGLQRAFRDYHAEREILLGMLNDKDLDTDEEGVHTF